MKKIGHLGLGTDGREEDEHGITVNTQQLLVQFKCNAGMRGRGFNQLKVGVRGSVFGL